MTENLEIKILNDFNYYEIIKNIIETDEFQSLKRINQHGTTRYFHSIRVSYYSYLIAKKLKMDTMSVSRAGMLHDFFFLTTTDSKRIKNKLDIFTFKHGKLAASNANISYKINKKEKNIIESHMFPFCTSLPKYKESFLICLVDKCCATAEFLKTWRYELSYIPNVLMILLINKLFS